MHGKLIDDGYIAENDIDVNRSKDRRILSLSIPYSELSSGFDNPVRRGYKIFVIDMIIMRRATEAAFRGRRWRSGAAVWFIESILLFAAFAWPAGMQESDPFYHKWLESGEISYFARNYARAVEYLEIAVFGLARQKDPLARGYVYLALSRMALGQSEPAAAALAAAANIVGWDGLRTMDLRFEARKELDKLLAKSSPAPPAAAKPSTENKKTEEASPPVEILPLPDTNRTEEPPPENPPETPPATLPEPHLETGAPSIRDLRRIIETDPRNSGPYFDLAFVYRQIRDYRNARETLEKLLDQNPAEIRAYLEIGRVEYLSGNTKSAVKALEKFLSLTANVPVEERFRDEGRALLLLCAAAKGDQKKVARLLREAEALFRPERFEKLTLDPADLERLRTLRRPPAE